MKFEIKNKPNLSDQDIYDGERYDFFCGLEDEDKRVKLLEIEYVRNSSSSDTE